LKILANQGFFNPVSKMKLSVDLQPSFTNVYHIVNKSGEERVKLTNCFPSEINKFIYVDFEKLFWV